MSDIEVARYALRTFRVTPDYGLGSVATDGGNWHNGTCTAWCTAYPSDHIEIFEILHRRCGYHPPGHHPPEKDCSCGIYGSLSLDHLVRQYYRQCADIVAVIAAEGATIIGPRGLRTEHARVVAYWTRYRDISRLAKRQFGSAERFWRINPMLSKYGIPRKLTVDPSPTARWWA